MKNLKVCSFIFVLLLVIRCLTKSQSHPNSIYVELLGKGGLYSLNYDRLFSENIGDRIGIMYLSSMEFLFTSAENFLMIPIILNYLSGTNHKLEMGIGAVIVCADNIGFFGIDSGGGKTSVGLTATIGYRYQLLNGGFLFRIGFTPFLHRTVLQHQAG